MQKVERTYYHYTESALEDELLFVLVSKTDCDIILGKNGEWLIHPFCPYINQAEGLIYKINVYDPLPEFIIWESHIPMGLAIELQNLGKVKMKKVITNAVRRIYESVNPEYFYKSGIYGKIKWRFGLD